MKDTRWVVDKATRHEMVAKRCGKCGVVRYDPPGYRSSCPFRTLHERAAKLASA